MPVEQLKLCETIFFVVFEKKREKQLFLTFPSPDILSIRSASSRVSFI
jgi:hypothetical protein